MASDKAARDVVELLSRLITHEQVVSFGVRDGLKKRSGAVAVIYLAKRVRARTFPHEVNGVPVTTMVIGKPKLEKVDDDDICFRGKVQLQ